MHEQMNLMDLFGPESFEDTSSEIEVVRASFIGAEKLSWIDLFEGFDELYAITYSSGLQFVNTVLDRFKYAEIIFGCESVMNNDIAAIISMQIESVRQLVKSKAAKHMAERLEDETLQLHVSRDMHSHEKIYILKAEDGRVRVITGSANMSASAFCGFQRENITYFDEQAAFDFYMHSFEHFREQCADPLPNKAIIGTMADPEFLLDNLDEIPIIQTLEKKKYILIEETHSEEENAAAEIVVSIKGHEHEMKPMMPKQKKSNGKILLTADMLQDFKRKHRAQREMQKAKVTNLPKLHINYETSNVDFNGEEFNMNPSPDAVAQDVQYLLKYLASLNCFYGDVEQSQKNYFAFFNWYFASPFMPYLRYVASKNNYGVIPFPVVGIIYGESNGGKSTFIKLLAKLMCGHKMPLNSSNDFTATKIENLKRACEGLPINIDDLAKTQFTNNCEKVIKDDEWGIPEGFIHYPAIVISTNKLASLTQDITKRAVTCHVDIRIDKDTGAKNSKRINESMEIASTSFFSEYARRMFDEIKIMEEQMKTAEIDYFPDIFAVSSKIIVEIISESVDNLPNYVSLLSYADYFGDRVVGRNAIQKILSAWRTEPKQFKVYKKRNTLTYTYPEQGRLYELAYIQQELPPALNARLTARSIVMDLDQAKIIFETSFKRGLFG